MIPLQLTMEAFGPFLESQTIDFTKLCGDKLFMISGPTGSGKTTVFDAMIFALYGEPSGGLRSSDQLKSDYAGEQTECSVSFRFWSGGAEYEVFRKPKQPYINRKGVPAFRPESARLSLPDGTELSGTTEVDEKIRSVLRLTRDQFRKIVMLPQGEFREMLNADSAEKQKIFRHLFSTGLYDSFIFRLKNETNQLEQAYRENEVACYSKLQTLPEYEQSSDMSLIDYDAALSEIRDRALTVKKGYDRLLKEKETVSKKADAINLDLMLEHNRKLDRLEQSRKILSEIERSEPEIASGRTLLSDLKKARDLKHLYDSLEEQKKILGEEQKKNLDLKDEKALSEKAAEESEKLYSQAVKDLEKLPGLEQKIAEYKRETEAVSEYEEVCAKRDLLEKEIGSTAKKIRLLDLGLQEIDADEKLGKTLRGRESLLRLQKAVEESRRAEDEFTLRETSFREGFRRFLSSQASFLAKELESGVPCPVCGSVDHPSPAPAVSGAVSPEEFDRLRGSYEKAREDALRSVTAVSDIFSSCVDHFPEGFTPDLCRTESDDLHLLSALAGNEKEISRLREQKDAIRASMEAEASGAPLPGDRGEIERELAERRDFLTGASSRMSFLKQECDKLREKLTPGESKDSLAEKIVLCEKEQKSIGDLHETRKIELERARLRVKHLEENIAESEQRITDSGSRLDKLSSEWKSSFREGRDFPEERFSELAPRLGEIDGLERKISEHERSKLRTESEIRTLTEELRDRERFPFEEKKAEKEALSGEAARLEKEVRDLHSQFSSLSGIAVQLEDLIRERKILADRFRDVNDLYQISRGNNPKRIDLERYVLSSYFDDVIERANLRLGRMTNDRYTMIRRTEREKGTRSSGLDIDVFDAYTGKSRHVNTLSGGESFQCALCLALGLSDAIAENAGGIRIDTLFIDEGFGSLDTQSLDTAVNCILSLKESGRIVGIISHVESLKERIPVQLEVIPGKSGSTLRMKGIG